MNVENKDLEHLLESSIDQLIGGPSGVNAKVKKLLEKHRKKVHFVPIKYRVLGGFLQSLNIRFGNFLALLLANIVDKENKLSVEKEISGRPQVPLKLEEECERRIDKFVNNPSSSSFPELLEIIFEKQTDPNGIFRTVNLDVDLLLRAGDIWYYVEIKYNDDHDTGKFADINRKFLKTFAGLVNKYNPKKGQMALILYYFNPAKRYQNPYLEEGRNLLRGDALFKEFKLSVSYKDLDILFTRKSKRLEKEFDEITTRIFRKVSEENNKKEDGT